MYEGFRSFGVEEIPDLGNVTQLKKRADLQTAVMRGTIDKELSRVTPVCSAVEEQLTTSSTMVRLPMFGLGQ